MSLLVTSLREALAMLAEIPGQLIETNVEVNPEAELSGIYRYVGAGGTVKRPTTVDGPAMIFHNVKGHRDASVVIGVMASRERVAKLFGCKFDCTVPFDQKGRFIRAPFLNLNPERWLHG